MNKQTSNKNNQSHQNGLLTYEGKPVPEWLQTPAFKQLPSKKEFEIPDWLTKPAEL